MSGTDIANIARQYLGTPFIYGGRDPVHGLDCFGHLLLVARQMDQCPLDFDLPPYTSPPDPTLFDQYLPQFMNEVLLWNMGPGDVVVLRAAVGGKRRREGAIGEPRHLGIIGDYQPAPGHLSLIYVNESAGLHRVTENRLDEETRGRIYKVFRFRNRTGE